MNGNYAVVERGADFWADYMEKASEHLDYYDFSDIQTIIYEIHEDGTWEHQHENPLYMEPVDPSSIEDETLRNALSALGEYFKCATENTNRKAVEASRAYAHNNIRIDKFDIDNIEDLLGVMRELD